jgi:hypothetical protein
MLQLRKAQAAVGTGKFLHKLEIPQFDHQRPLIGVEKEVDFRLADWLLKGDARQHLEGRRCHFKIPARSAILLAQICGQGFAVDFCSQERNHPVENPPTEGRQGRAAGYRK